MKSRTSRVRVGHEPTYSFYLIRRKHYVCNEWVLHAVDIVGSTWHIFESFVSGETHSFSAVATTEPLSLLVWMCHPDLKSLFNWCCIPPTHTSATLRKNVHDPVPIKTPTSPDTSDASSPLYDQSHAEQFYQCNHHQKYIITTYFTNSFFDSVAQVVMSDCYAIRSQVRKDGLVASLHRSHLGA